MAASLVSLRHVERPPAGEPERAFVFLHGHYGPADETAVGHEVDPTVVPQLRDFLGSLPA